MSSDLALLRDLFLTDEEETVQIKIRFIYHVTAYLNGFRMVSKFFFSVSIPLCLKKKKKKKKRRNCDKFFFLFFFPLFP